MLGCTLRKRRAGRRAQTISRVAGTMSSHVRCPKQPLATATSTDQESTADTSPDDVWMTYTPSSAYKQTSRFIATEVSGFVSMPLLNSHYRVPTSITVLRAGTYRSI